MKRRSFLAMLGMAPAAATIAAVLPRQEFASGGIVRPGSVARVGEFVPEVVIKSTNLGEYKPTGMLLDRVDSGVTRVVVRAEQFVIRNNG